MGSPEMAKSEILGVGKLGDDVLTIGLVVGGGIVAYTLYKSFQVGQGIGSYGAGKIDDAQNYVTGGISRVTGAPAWAWRETIGQGGLGLTGNKPATRRNTTRWSTGGGQAGSRQRDTTTDSNRALLRKDDNSWGWGYGPRKGWLLG